MNWYRADLHIHSVLSPCGDLDMSPARIILEAKKKNLDIIGIADHNSTLHAETMIALGKKEGITVFPGVEVNTVEEVHCLAFFDNTDKTNLFQKFLDSSMTGIKNNPDKFGMQLLVNEKEEILNQVDDLLIVGITRSIDEVEKKVHELDGIFIPAHVDRPVNGIYSQMGFLPPNLKVDAIEIAQINQLSEFTDKKQELKSFKLITNSDAHYPEQIGSKITEYLMQSPTFSEWRKALKNEGGRQIRITNE